MSVFEIFESNSRSKIKAMTDLIAGPVKARTYQSGKASQTESFGLQVQFALKRFTDIVVSFSAILVLSPLLICVAILIRLDSSGPALLSQNRWGKDGSKIRIYKFRSMRFAECDISGVAQTQVNDPRITRIGAFLRKSNIDELPQLFNILKGDMSLVGPRCHVPGMLAAGKLYEDLVPNYHQRHKVRPGLTGLAQVRGLRGPTVRPSKARARIAADLYYIENFSLWLDVKILIGTVWVELRNGSGL